MPLIEESIQVPRPQQEVFDFLSRFENRPVYDRFVTASGQVGDAPMGVGTRGWGKTSFMGQEFDWTVEYTEFEPPTRMESRDVGGRRDLRVVYTLEPVEGGTMVTQQMEVTTGLGMLGVLPAPVLKAMLSRALRATLAALAQHLATHPNT